MRAIVIGAGIGGMLAAAAARTIADDVIVLERDGDAGGGARRAGVAQGRQLHNLLSSGVESIEALLPGFADLVVREGGVKANVALDTEVLEFGFWMPRRDLGLALMCASRPTLERALRCLLRPTTNVTIRDGVRVEDILVDARGAACGVATRNQTGACGEVHGDVVIDASACGFNTIKWAAGHGFAAPEVARDEVGQWYVSGLFARPAQWRNADRFWMIFPTPPASRGGLVSPVAGDLWHVSVSGRMNDAPPATLQSFQAYAASLDDPAIARLIERATLCAPEDGSPSLHLYRRPVAQWRQFRAEALPPRFLPLGDAIAALNPLFGQGMSVAAMQAGALRDALAAGLGGGARDWPAAAARYLNFAHQVIGRAWDLQAAFGPDMRDRIVGAGLDMSAYFSCIARLLNGRPDLHRAYVDVWHLRTHWRSLCEPWVQAIVASAQGPTS